MIGLLFASEKVKNKFQPLKFFTGVGSHGGTGGEARRHYSGIKVPGVAPIVVGERLPLQILGDTFERT